MADLFFEKPAITRPAPKVLYETLPECLRIAASSTQSNHTYLTFLGRGGEETHLSYKETYDGALRFAAGLRGLPKDGRVLLLMPGGADFVFAFFGVQIAGGSPVPVALPMFGGHDHIAPNLLPTMLDADCAAIIADAQHAEAAAILNTQIHGGFTERVLFCDDLRQNSPATHDSLPQALSGNDIALIQYTSGPQRHPRGVALSHQAILTSVAATGEALELSKDDIALSWIPMVHDMGLIGTLLSSLYWRYRTYIMQPQAFLMRPHTWLQNISTYKATLSAAPNFAYQLVATRLRDSHLKDLNLSSWRVALNGAEMVLQQTVDAFCARVAPTGFSKNAMLPIYGLAENTLGTTCPVPGSGCVSDPISLDVCVGHAIGGQQVEVRPTARQQGQEASGEIVIGGPTLMQGYRQNPEATRSLIPPNDPYLRTGDLGYLKNGHLFVSGRCKDLVIKMGRNYYASDIEEVAADALGSHSCDNIAVPHVNHASGSEDLVLVSRSPKPQADVESLTERVNEALLDHLGLRADQVVFVSDEEHAHLRESPSPRVAAEAWLQKGGDAQP